MNTPDPESEYRSGQEVPASGIYTSYNSEDQEVGEVTCVEREPFPPSENGGYFKLREAANGTRKLKEGLARRLDAPGP